ncbi:MAG: tetratricopeptide repeat protein, partial [Gemmataceae bacterium]|nr:tetratricopeptide repeat protein [Gemmataceae bacterium]
SSVIGIGNVHIQVGQTERAKAEFETALALRKKLADAEPNVPVRRRDVAVAHRNLAVALEKQGKYDAALAEIDRAITLLKKVIDEAPKVGLYREDLAAAFRNRSNVLALSGKRDDALTYAEQAAEMREDLVRLRPKVAKVRADLAGEYNNIARLRGVSDQIDRADLAFEKAISLLESATRDDPDTPDYQVMLAQSLSNRAVLLQGTGRSEQAIILRGRARGALEQLVSKYPHVPQYRDDLARATTDHAWSLLNARKTREARSAFAEADRHWSAVMVANPNPVAAAGHSLCLTGLGDLDRNEKRDNTALAFYVKACDVVANYAKNPVTWPTVMNSHREARNRRAQLLASLGRHAEAVAEYDALLATEPKRESLGAFRISRALSLARLGRVEEALEETRGFAEANSPAQVPEEWHKLARMYAILAAKVRTDPTRTAAERDRQADELAARSVYVLDKAVEEKYFASRSREERLQRLEDLNLSEDWKELRQRKEFRTLYEEILKTARQ